MPIYEYRCADCGMIFDRAENMSEHETVRPRCPECESDKVEQLFSSFFAKTAKKS